MNEAFSLHSLQIADNLVTDSQRGISCVMLAQESLKKVPWSELIITTLRLLAAVSANSTISVKNYPSSTPITSKFIHTSPSSDSFSTGIASLHYPLWVAIIHLLSYRLSAQNLTLNTLFPEISARFNFFKSSVDFPANIVPMIRSMRPRYLVVSRSFKCACSCL